MSHFKTPLKLGRKTAKIGRIKVETEIFLIKAKGEIIRSHLMLKHFQLLISCNFSSAILTFIPLFSESRF